MTVLVTEYVFYDPALSGTAIPTTNAVPPPSLAGSSSSSAPPPPTTGQLWPRSGATKVVLDTVAAVQAPLVDAYLGEVSASTITYDVAVAAGDMLLVHVMHRGTLTAVPAGLAQVGATQSHAGGVNDAYTQWSSVYFLVASTEGRRTGTFTQTITPTGAPGQERMEIQALVLRGVSTAAFADWQAQTAAEDLTLTVTSPQTLLLLDAVTGGADEPSVNGFSPVCRPISRLSSFYGAATGQVLVDPPASSDTGIMAVTLA